MAPDLRFENIISVKFGGGTAIELDDRTAGFNFRTLMNAGEKSSEVENPPLRVVLDLMRTGGKSRAAGTDTRILEPQLTGSHVTVRKAR